MKKKEHCSDLSVGQVRMRLPLDFFQNKAMDMSIRQEVVEDYRNDKLPKFEQFSQPDN